MVWLCVFIIFIFMLGMIAGSALALFRYKHLGISHPKRIEERLRMGLNTGAAAPIKNKYLEGYK